MSVDQGCNLASGEKLLDRGWVLNIQLTVFSDGLDTEREGKRKVKDDTRMFDLRYCKDTLPFTRCRRLLKSQKFEYKC
jgi:hypothetical protein